MARRNSDAKTFLNQFVEKEVSGRIKTKGSEDKQTDEITQQSELKFGVDQNISPLPFFKFHSFNRVRAIRNSASPERCHRRKK